MTLNELRIDAALRGSYDEIRRQFGLEPLTDEEYFDWKSRDLVIQPQIKAALAAADAVKIPGKNYSLCLACYCTGTYNYKEVAHYNNELNEAIVERCEKSGIEVGDHREHFLIYQLKAILENGKIVDIIINPGCAELDKFLRIYYQQYPEYLYEGGHADLARVNALMNGMKRIKENKIQAGDTAKEEKSND